MNAENRCEVDLWTCGCHQTNYLELTTRGKIGKQNYGGRLAYSAYPDPGHMTLLGSALGVDPYAN